MKKITCFIPVNDTEIAKQTIESLKKSCLTGKIYLLATSDEKFQIDDCETLKIDSLNSAQSLQLMAEKADTDYSLIYQLGLELDLGQFALERFYGVAEDTGAGMVYSDYIEIKNQQRANHPVIDYQAGSLRDDFNFGSLLFYRTEALKNAAATIEKDYKFAALYDLRLKTTQKFELVRVPEFLYTTVETDTRKSGEKQFDYVDPRNRDRQIEMEDACTYHLKAIGGYLAPEFKDINLNEGSFECEASVIIPVRNRIKTVADAIESVMKQKADFKYNLIIVDNFSTDGTTEKIKEFTAKYDNIIHIIPERKDLGIGGCWNKGVHHEKCGRFAVQLDSDDIYKDETTLQKVVDVFRKEKCAMVIGSYQMTNFKLEEIPPGIIDHKEWTPENGRNNALRINGLGAPRAFYTPLLRDIKVPNVSYGEDYALGLNISREYQIGRIYTPIYQCRRWDDNTDASLDINKMNAHNTYKDRVRTYELLARIRKNATK